MLPSDVTVEVPPVDVVSVGADCLMEVLRIEVEWEEEDIVVSDCAWVVSCEM